MTELTRFELAEGGSVVVEVDEPPGFTRVSGRQSRILHATGESFEQALRQVRDAANSALHQFQAMSRRPDEVKLTFGVKLDVEAGAVIARTGVEGNFQVSLTWKAAATS